MRCLKTFPICNYFFISFLLIFFFASNLFSFNVATHMYIGRHTFDVWKDFDPTFYNLISNTYPSYDRYFCRKFYYIGLTLPDLLSEKGQKHSEEFLEKTIEVWQPYSDVTLTNEDAKEITKNMVQLFEFLIELDKKYSS